MRKFVEDYLEKNGVLRHQLRTTVDMNSTEAIISAVESGLGIGFVPYLAVQKALRLGSVKAIRLENGPILRQLSIALLNGPELRGPVGQLLSMFRENGGGRWRAPDGTVPERSGSRVKNAKSNTHSKTIVGEESARIPSGKVLIDG